MIFGFRKSSVAKSVARPMFEALEGRRLLSSTAAGGAPWGVSNDGGVDGPGGTPQVPPYPVGLDNPPISSIIPVWPTLSPPPTIGNHAPPRDVRRELNRIDRMTSNLYSEVTSTTKTGEQLYAKYTAGQSAKASLQTKYSVDPSAALQKEIGADQAANKKLAATVTADEATVKADVATYKSLYAQFEKLDV